MPPSPHTHLRISIINIFYLYSSKSKCLKDLVLNDGKANYGDCIWSNGITCTSNGDIFLVDRFEHRVLVFNKEFIYKYQIGSRGSSLGQFDEPSDICISESGKLYVADKNNSRVQIFSEPKRNRGESKGVKLSTSFSFGFNGLDGLFSATPTKSTKSMMSPYPSTAKTTKTKIFKTTSEFCYHNCIKLDDKPIKLCSSPFSGNMAVSTKNGQFIHINSTTLKKFKFRVNTKLSILVSFFVIKQSEIVKISNKPTL